MRNYRVNSDLYNWRAGASQPSHANGWYIFICDGTVFGPAYKLLYFIWTPRGCPRATRKRKAGSFKGQN